MEDVMLRYEGICMFCKRDIGSGHKKSCRYWRPKET